MRGGHRLDKFQGQQAPLVIYSLTTSTQEDAPRGMEFLYSLNRLNVATSRAQAIVIVVGSPRLLEPECRSPRQMQLANALCRYARNGQNCRDSIIKRKARDRYSFVEALFRQHFAVAFHQAKERDKALWSTGVRITSRNGRWLVLYSANATAS